MSLQPAHSQEVVVGGIVPGSARDVYRAPVFAPPLPAPVLATDYWLEGGPTDELSKLAGLPTARIDTTKPTDAETAMQTTVPGADEDSATDPANAIWSGPYAGEIDGEVTVRTFWSTVNPLAASAATATVSFFADGSAIEPARLIGRRQLRLTPGIEPSLNVNKVRVKGAVEQTLTLVVTAVYVDGSSDLRTSYGSASYPAGFSVPPAGSASLTSTRPVPEHLDRVPTLAVQAVDVGKSSAEPTLGVARDGTAYFGAFDSGTAVMRSKDGGLSWDHLQASLGSIDEPFISLDPYLYLDEETGRLFSIDLYAGCSYLVFSDDGGETWQRNPALCGSPGNDHQTVVAGPVPDGVPKGSYGRTVWYCASQVIDAVCGRSDDGGQTMLPAAAPAFIGYDEEAGGLCAGYHGHIRTDSAGRMFVPKGHCNLPWVAMTDDGGASFTQVRVTRDVSAAGFHINIAVDEADNVYVAWWDAEHKLPWMASSRDHGATWGTPVMVAPPGVKEVNFPSIAAGAAGRVTITFPGTTSDEDTPHRPWNSYVVVTEDALAARPVFESATANDPMDPIHRGPCQSRCAGMLDFLDAVVSPAGEVWAAVVDTCTVTVSCTVNTGPDDVPSGGVAQSSDGIAVRQLCGPAMRGPARLLRGPGCAAASAGPVIVGPQVAPDGTLPRTGGSALTAALLALAGGLGAARLLGRDRGVHRRPD